MICMEPRATELVAGCASGGQRQDRTATGAPGSGPGPPGPSSGAPGSGPDATGPGRLRICRSSLLRVSSRFSNNQQPVVVVSRLIGLKVKSCSRRTPQTQSSGKAALLLLAPFLSASSLASLFFIPWFTLLAALRVCSTRLAPTGGLPQLRSWW